MAICNISRPLSLLGQNIGRSPTIYIVAMLAFSVACMMGLTSLEFESDTDKLFVPVHAPGLEERKLVEDNFGRDFDRYFVGHETRRDPEIIIIMTAKDGGNMIREEIWDEVVRLNETVASKTTFSWRGRDWGYRDLCARQSGAGSGCVQNNFLTLHRHIRDIVSGKINLTYPVMKNEVTRETYFFPRFFGGVTLARNSSQVANVTAIRMTYPLNPRPRPSKLEPGQASQDDEDELEKLPLLWQQSVVAFNFSGFSHIQVHVISSLSIEQELLVNLNSALDLFPHGLFLVLVFTVFNCMNRDHPEESCPILGLMGVLTIFLATGSAWGILAHWFSVPWQSINLASIFLMLGVGLDNAFVMMSAWNMTKKALPVVERMRESYNDAAVSITVTSVANVISFAVGIVTGFRCVAIFCIYTAAGLFAIYLWNLTFFGACMALSANFNEWLLDREGRGGVWRMLALFCDKRCRTSGTDETIVPEESFFGDALGKFLIRPRVKSVVIAILVGYLAISVYFITNMKEGLQRRFLALDDSAVVKFYDLEDSYFRQSPYRIQIVLPPSEKDDGREETEYWSSDVQTSITALIANFTDSKFISKQPEFEENWLKEFLSYAGERELPVTSRTDFMRELSEFLGFARDTPLARDVILSEDKSRILCSRFLLQSSAVADAVEEGKMVKALRGIAETAPFNVSVFHVFFPYFDQYLEVLPDTLSSVGLGLVINVIITVVLISNFWGTLWITVTILSIEAGVCGFMVAWDINLDVISMISLNMCLGFSVDYSAHITNHFVRASADSSDERARDSLRAYGLPIAQSAFATFLGIIVLLFIPSYILQSFAKMMILVIVFGVMHGLVVLPVFLSLFQPITCAKLCGKKSSKEEQGQNLEMVDKEDPIKDHEGASADKD